MEIVLKDISAGPVYLQIRQQIENHIHEKVLVSGSPLPSLESLVRKLSVDRGEIQRAYFELEQAGLIARSSTKDFLGKLKTTYSVK
jgi:GntR family transcriptional regulator